MVVRKGRGLRSRERTAERHPYNLRLFHLNEGLPSLALLRTEIQDMVDVLMGRLPPPINVNNVEAMLEVADAYFARASEITMLIQRAEAQGNASDSYKKFRTGELRTVMEMFKRTADLGSRRITVRGQRIDAERLGRDSRFST